MKAPTVVLCVMAVLTIVPALAEPPADPANFLFLDADDASDHRDLLARPDIAGAQIIYNWKMLEPEKDRYDFSKIERDLRFADSLHRKLFIIVADRFFYPGSRNVPVYLLTDPVYHGGLVPQRDSPGSTTGWVSMQWIPAVRHRFQRLLHALAGRFDGRLYGINIGETAADVDLKDGEKGFTCDGYFAAEMENIAFTRKAFHKTYVVQDANFWPCGWNNDHHYMSRAFAYAYAHGIGMGGPDIVPYKKAQMKNSYPFLHDYRGKLKIVAMGIQEPTLEYINPDTGKPFTKDEFVSFARDYLGVDIIFWAYISPWLQKPPPGP